MKKIAIKLAVIIFALILISGCATGYHRQGWTGGYSESQLQKDVFKVSFKGNAFVSKEKAQDYLFLRCAEVTIDNGFDYFIILDEDDYENIGSYTTPTHIKSQSTTTGNVNYSGNIYGNSIYGTGTYSGQTRGRATVTGGQTLNFSKPRSTCVIKCFKGQKPEDLPSAFVAYELIGYLKDKVK